MQLFTDPYHPQYRMDPFCYKPFTSSATNVNKNYPVHKFPHLSYVIVPTCTDASHL